MATRLTLRTFKHKKRKVSFNISLHCNCAEKLAFLHIYTYYCTLLVNLPEKNSLNKRYFSLGYYRSMDNNWRNWQRCCQVCRAGKGTAISRCPYNRDNSMERSKTYTQKGTSSQRRWRKNIFEIQITFTWLLNPKYFTCSKGSVHQRNLCNSSKLKSLGATLLIVKTAPWYIKAAFWNFKG